MFLLFFCGNWFLLLKGLLLEVVGVWRFLLGVVVGPSFSAVGLATFSRFGGLALARLSYRGGCPFLFGGFGVPLLVGCRLPSAGGK